MKKPEIKFVSSLTDDELNTMLDEQIEKSIKDINFISKGPRVLADAAAQRATEDIMDYISCMNHYGRSADLVKEFKRQVKKWGGKL